MKKFVLTGAPGSGKTCIIRQLELDGFSVVEEAATDVIALQQAQGIENPGDRLHSSMQSRICKERGKCAHPSRRRKYSFTIAPSFAPPLWRQYLGYPVSDTLARELERIKSEAIFQRCVFFIRNLGFISHTEARRISFEETLRFERIHEETYRDFGFEIVFIEPGSVSDRVAAIKAALVL